MIATRFVDRAGHPIADDLQQILHGMRGQLQRKYAELRDESVMDTFLECCAREIEVERAKEAPRDLRRYAYWLVFLRADRCRRQTEKGRFTPRGFRGGDRFAAQYVDLNGPVEREHAAPSDPMDRLPATDYGSAVRMEQRALCAEFLATLTPDERDAVRTWLDHGGNAKRVVQRACDKLRATFSGAFSLSSSNKVG